MAEVLLPVIALDPRSSPLRVLAGLIVSLSVGDS